MKRLLTALALAAFATACGDAADEGPTEEEMKAAASTLLMVPEERITQFTKQKCRTQDEGYICEFEMYITFGAEPSRQDLNKGYFFKPGEDEEWRMELVG